MPWPAQRGSNDDVTLLRDLQHSNIRQNVSTEQWALREKHKSYSGMVEDNHAKFEYAIKLQVLLLRKEQVLWASCLEEGL